MLKRGPFIDRLANNIENAPQGLSTDRNRNHVAGITDRQAA